MKVLRALVRSLIKESLLKEAYFFDTVKKGIVTQDEYDATVEHILKINRGEIPQSYDSESPHRVPYDFSTGKVTYFKLGNFDFVARLSVMYPRNEAGKAFRLTIPVMYISDFNHVLFNEDTSEKIKHEVITGNHIIVNLLFTKDQSEPTRSDLEKYYAIQKDLVQAKQDVDRSKYHEMLAEKVIDTMLMYFDDFVKEYEPPPKKVPEFEDTPMEKYGEKGLIDRLKNK